MTSASAQALIDAIKPPTQAFIGGHRAVQRQENGVHTARLVQRPLEFRANHFGGLTGDGPP